MSRYDPKAILDGFNLITRGVNSGLAPSSLGRDQMAWAINTTFRDGYAHHRPGLVKRELDFSDANDASLQTNFEDHIFQGAAAFERVNQLVTSIGGRLFRISLDNWSVLNITTPDRNPNNRYRAWFTEAEDFMVIQDGQSAPWLYNGASTVRSDTFGQNGARQPPSGQAMVYSGGRLMVTLPDAKQFVVGDIVGGDSGTITYNYRDAVIYFTENTIIGRGGAFSTPINSGSINALCPVAQVDTSTGQGPTQVFTTSAIFSLNAPTERAAWATVNFPLGTVSMVSGGALSDRATVNVNGDIWFRSLDGIRSFIVARRDFSTSWVNAPMSKEVDRALARDDRNLLGFASAALFDGRLLMTVQPYRRWYHGICHRGLVVMDFSPLAFMSTRVDPVWEGVWTGVQVLQILTGTFNGIQRCFIFALNDAFKIELWELTRNALTDVAGSTSTEIEWSIETGALNFPRESVVPGRPGKELQSLDGGELAVDDISGTVSFNLDYRPDQDPCWYDWHDWSVCAIRETCGTQGSQACVSPADYQKQYRKPFRLPQPTEDCDPVTNKRLNVFWECQIRLNITGSCRIKRLEAIAHDQQENVNDLCAEFEYCEALTCSTCADDFSYEVHSTYNDGDAGTYISSNISGSGDLNAGGGYGGGGNVANSGDGFTEPPPILADTDADADGTTDLNEWDRTLYGPDYPYVGTAPTGVQNWQPSYTSPDGQTWPIGVEPLSGVPVGGDPTVDGYTGLEAGVFEQWAAAAWASWITYKQAQGITVSYEKLYWTFNLSPSQPRFHANSVFGSSVTWSKGSWSWEIWVEFLEV